MPLSFPSWTDLRLVQIPTLAAFAALPRCRSQDRTGRTYAGRSFCLGIIVWIFLPHRSRGSVSLRKTLDGDKARSKVDLFPIVAPSTLAGSSALSSQKIAAVRYERD